MMKIMPACRYRTEMNDRLFNGENSVGRSIRLDDNFSKLPA